LKVILDCDPGNGYPGADIDDGLALGLILRSPEFQLQAVTVVGGNTPVDAGVLSGLAMLEAAESNIPLYRGAERPLVEDPVPWRAALDGRGKEEPASSLWAQTKTPQPRGKATSGDAARAIVRIVDENPGEVTIIAVGPLTNVARAIMIDPELPQKVARIVIMGGGFGVLHKPQELNFGYDPEAAKIVVTAGAPTTLVPLDTTLKTSLSLEENGRLLGSSDPLAVLLGATNEPWIKYIMQTRNRTGCALHDPLAVAVVLDPSLVTIHTVPVDVELAGRLTRARPVSWIPDDPSPNAGVHLPSIPPIDVAVDVENEPFVKLMMDRLLSPTGQS
jgi:inosine-uridine nucleoside N-ribohydrolase